MRAQIVDPEGLSISVITIGCAGACVEVGVAVNGGNPPYMASWDDDSTSLTRTLCPEADTRFSVEVKDTPRPAGEFQYPGASATASVAALLDDCSDDDPCAAATGRAGAPSPGSYRGTATYTCDNDADPTAAAVINNGTLALELASEPATGRQRGKLYFQWGLVVIVGSTELIGELECGDGPLRASSVDGLWGLPGLDEMSLIPAGTWDVELKAWSEGPEAIAGTFRWEAVSAMTSNHCDVVFSATRMR